MPDIEQQIRDLDEAAEQARQRYEYALADKLLREADRIARGRTAEA